MAKIVLKFKEVVRMEYPLDGPITAIGRTPNNDICIDNLAVSRNHAQIVREGECFVIEDLDSNNGTFVNGNRIHRHILNDNDTIQVGKHTLQFLSSAEAAQAPEFSRSMSGGGAMDFNNTYVFNAAHDKPSDQAPVRLPTPPEEVRRTPLSESQRLSATQRTDALVTGQLNLLEGDLPQRRIELIRPATTFGKGADCSIRLSGFLTPALAAVIHRKADGYFLTPMAGGSKTRLNGEKMNAPQKLSHGDVVEICGLRFAFELPVEP